MKKIIVGLIFSISCIFISTGLMSQCPPIQWQNTIGGSSHDFLYEINEIRTGGYILGGFSYSGISGDKIESSNGSYDYWVIKIDDLGNIVWQNTIGGDGQDQLRSVQPTFDDGYILGGFSDSNLSGDKTEGSMGGNDYWIIKLDSLGNIEWQNTIGGDGPDMLQSIRQTSDGGYIMGGWSSSTNSGDKGENSIGGIDFWIVKTDNLGNIEWENTIGGDNSDVFYSIEQIFDGSYIIGGCSNSGISGDKTEPAFGVNDYWVLKIDSIGNVIWQNVIGGSAGDVLYDIEQCSDNGFVLSGSSQSPISVDKTEANIGSIDYWIVKIDSVGNIVWQNTIGGNDADVGYSIQQTVEGGYIVGGQSSSSISGDKTENQVGQEDFWVNRLDVSGILLWENTIGGDELEDLRSVRQTEDGGFLLGGTSASNISGDKTENSFSNYADYWVVKICPEIIEMYATDTILCDTAAPILLTGNPFGGVFWGDGVQGTTFNPQLAGAGTHTIVYTYATTCPTDTMFIIVTPCGVNESVGEADPAQIKIYPNPANNEITIDIQNESLVVLYNLLGVAVLKSTVSAGLNSIDISNQSKGIYLLSIENKNGTIREKIIKE